MRLIVKRAEFLKALQTASLALPNRTTKDVLKNVLLTAETNAIVLTGTNSEIWLSASVSDVVHADAGVCLLSPRVLMVLNELTSEEVRLEVQPDCVWITGTAFGGNSEFRLSIEDASAFPPMAKVNEKAFFKVKGADLRRLIKRTIFATDNESTRYACGGIQVEFGIDRKAIFAATDSRRLAVDSTPFEPFGGPEAPAVAPVIPNKAMKLLFAIAEEEAEVQVALHENNVSVRAGLVTITSQFIAGKFPDWRKVIPKRANITIEFVVGALLGAIKQAMIIRSEESRGIEFSLSTNRLRLAGDLKDLGESKVDLPIEYGGEPMKIHFDPVYFADVLKVLDPKSKVSLRLISKEDPGLLETGDGFQYVIMPLSKD